MAKFFGPVTSIAVTDYFACFDIQGRKQRSGAVSFIVCRWSLNASGSQRQDRLCPIKGLNLALLIDGKNQGAVRRTQIESHHITDFLDKQGIARKRIGAGSVWFKPKSAPNTADRGLAESEFFCHHARAPVCRPLGPTFQGSDNNSLNFIVTNLSWRSGPTFIKKRLDATLEKSLAQSAHGLIARAQSLFDFSANRTSSQHENYSSPERR